MIAPGLDTNLDHELNRELQGCDLVTQSDSVGLSRRATVIWLHWYNIREDSYGSWTEKRRYPRGYRRNVDRGAHRPAIEPRAITVPTAIEKEARRTWSLCVQSTPRCGP